MHIPKTRRSRPSVSTKLKNLFSVINLSPFTRPEYTFKIIFPPTVGQYSLHICGNYCKLMLSYKPNRKYDFNKIPPQKEENKA